MNSIGDSADRALVMREYSATVGATDGSIIAAIITTQAPRNQPKPPRPVQGPASMSRIRTPVDHQATAASAKSTATSPSRERTAAHAGVSPARPGALCAGAITDQAAQENPDFESPVLPSYSMPKALIRERFASAIVRSEPTGWNMPLKRIGWPDSTPNGTMSSISKSIASPTRTL